MTAQELNAVGEFEFTLVRRIVVNSLRMQRGADHQTASRFEHIRLVEADFVAPEGLDEVQVANLRAETIRRAILDTSRVATLARKNETAAERSFYLLVKELRQFQRQPKGLGPTIQPKVFLKELGLKSPYRMSDAEFDAMIAKYDSGSYFPLELTPRQGPSVPASGRFPAGRDSFELSFAVGRVR